MNRSRLELAVPVQAADYSLGPQRALVASFGLYESFEATGAALRAGETSR